VVVLESFVAGAVAVNTCVMLVVAAVAFVVDVVPVIPFVSGIVAVDTCVIGVVTVVPFALDVVYLLILLLLEL
jgi:hypothetical protein